MTRNRIPRSPKHLEKIKCTYLQIPQCDRKRSFVMPLTWFANNMIIPAHRRSVLWLLITWSFIENKNNFLVFCTGQYYSLKEASVVFDQFLCNLWQWHIATFTPPAVCEQARRNSQQKTWSGHRRCHLSDSSPYMGGTAKGKRWHDCDVQLSPADWKQSKHTVAEVVSLPVTGCLEKEVEHDSVLSTSQQRRCWWYNY